MIVLQLATFAFLLGLVPSGVAATLFELGAGQPVSFRSPFASARHPLRTAAVAAMAGPFMLGNEALAAWREGRLTALGCAACGLACILWVTLGGFLLALLAGGIAARLEFGAV